MLLGLWIARNDNQVRGVMVAGASCLLALSIWLTIDFIQARAGGDTSEMLHTYAVDVSSGIETNGLKDKTKMAAFVAAVRKEEEK